jgi:hypothetical protein
MKKIFEIHVRIYGCIQFSTSDVDYLHRNIFTSAGLEHKVSNTERRYRVSSILALFSGGWHFCLVFRWVAFLLCFQVSSILALFSVG